MASGVPDRTAELTRRAAAALADTQPWPDQFRRRALEVRALSRLVDVSAARRVLELGCGNAFGAALMADDRDLVVATDLAAPDPHTHSIGLRKAEALVTGLGLEHVRVVGASGEHLPFPAGSFDLIFSLFVLEHVPNREACLREMHRVLTGDGVMLHAVPATAWALTAPLHLYVHLARRAIAAAVRRRHPTGAAAGPPAGRDDAAGERAQPWQRFRRHYPHFPLPPPHAAYANYLVEVVSYSRRRWMRLFERHGFTVVACEPLMQIPLGLLELVVGRRALDLYERLFTLDQRLARVRPLRPCAQFLGIVATKGC